MIAWVFLLFTSCQKDKNPVIENLNNPGENEDSVNISYPYIDTLSFITYNVAGLPEVLSHGDPAHNTSEIGRRLSPYAVVAVQEDFNYNHFLYGTDKHPFRTSWSGPVPIGDGLNVMSNYKISDLKRNKWDACNGFDCLTPKGFTYNKLQIVEGATIDIYDVHANAGQDEKDHLARQSNLFQLYHYIETHSQGQAVIIMGDFNSRYSYIGDTAEIFYQLGFTDTWMDYTRKNLGFPSKNNKNTDTVCESQPGTFMCETEDKIFYRSSDKIKLNLIHFDRPKNEFMRDGKDMSDHIPVTSDFEITVKYK